jgi:hypothetical protein
MSDAKSLLLRLTPGEVRRLLSSNRGITAYVIVGVSLLLLLLCVVYVTARFVGSLSFKMKTPTMDDRLKHVEKKGMRRGLVRGVERRPGIKVG